MPPISRLQAADAIVDVTNRVDIGFQKIIDETSQDMPRDTILLHLALFRTDVVGALIRLHATMMAGEEMPENPATATP